MSNQRKYMIECEARYWNRSFIEKAKNNPRTVRASISDFEERIIKKRGKEAAEKLFKEMGRQKWGR